MKVSREEILHIANLARLDLEENEIDKYLENLDDILNFAEIVNNAPVEGLDITIGANEAKNVFRKDEVKYLEIQKVYYKMLSQQSKTCLKYLRLFKTNEKHRLALLKFRL